MVDKLDKVLVLDYGSQYNQLITRRIREMGVFSELKSRNMTAEEIKSYNPKAIILSGGPKSVYEENAFTIDSEIFNLDIPVLGVCYGMQLMAQELGGKVEANPGNGEFGQTVLQQTESAGRLLADTPVSQTVLMSHSDNVIELPEGFKVIGGSDKTPIAAIANEERRLYGVQFHAETTLSENGKQILTNFVKNIAEAESNWDMSGFIDEQIQKIREIVGDKRYCLDYQVVLIHPLLVFCCTARLVTN